MTTHESHELYSPVWRRAPQPGSAITCLTSSSPRAPTPRGRLRAARAVELTKRTSRERVADEIEQLLRFPDEPHRLRVGPHSAATYVNHDALQQLADLLRSETPLQVRGLARLQIALTDGTGPLYTDRGGRALAHELERVQAALIG